MMVRRKRRAKKRKKEQRGEGKKSGVGEEEGLCGKRVVEVREKRVMDGREEKEKVRKKRAANGGEVEEEDGKRRSLGRRGWRERWRGGGWGEEGGGGRKGWVMRNGLAYGPMFIVSGCTRGS